ncbi:MAG: acetylglutamate kinase [Sediminibacterium sp.]|jgi:acetylglutamate kinase|nr:acetylglutamate kinase [Chitinophagaceae bacterium]MCA6447537.1 acetylglutamate kinase [Chitinophagaceae bacterium]
MQELVVIKIGGNIIDDENSLLSFLVTLAQLQQSSKQKFILVHGGGKLATKMATDMGVEQQMIDGRRITDAETLKIVTMVYAGYINKNIVARLQANGSNAIGFTGADGNLIKAHKRIHPTIDYGFVGDIDAVNEDAITHLLHQFDILVMAPITHDGQGLLLNTNADTIAQTIATSLANNAIIKLIYSFEKEGVLLDINKEDTVIPVLNKTYYATLRSQGAIFAGMLPKLDNAFNAIEKGVKQVIIGKAEKLAQLIAGKAGTSIVYE